MLRRVLEFVRKPNQTASTVGNSDAVLAFTGVLSPLEGDRIAKDLADDFNKIEGEW